MATRAEVQSTREAIDRLTQMVQFLMDDRSGNPEKQPITDTQPPLTPPPPSRNPHSSDLASPTSQFFWWGNIFHPRKHRLWGWHQTQNGPIGISPFWWGRPGDMVLLRWAILWDEWYSRHLAPLHLSLPHRWKSLGMVPRTQGQQWGHHLGWICTRNSDPVWPGPLWRPHGDTV